MNLQKREELKNIIDEGFWHYYRLNKRVKPKVYNKKPKALAGIKDIFRTLQEMLYESNHGASIKGLGVIVPGDTEVVKPIGICRTEIVIYSRYKLFFEKEYFSQYYKVTIKKPYNSPKNPKVVREPKPYAVMLHRKKVRKN